MKYLITILLTFLMIGCMNKVEVPAKVEQCFKDPKTGECTNQVEVTVRHIISIELPTVFTDSCRKKFNETDYPDAVVREAGYQQCITDYINQLMSVVNGLNPQDLPPNLTGAQ